MGKMEGGPAGTCPTLQGLVLARFPVDFRRFAFKGMVLDLMNRIEKISKRKTKKMAHAQANGGGVHPRAKSCLFPIQIA